MKITKTLLKQIIKEELQAEQLSEGYGRWDDELQDPYSPEERTKAAAAQGGIEAKAEARVGQYILIKNQPIRLGAGNWNSPVIWVPVVFEITNVHSAGYILPGPGHHEDPGPEIVYDAIADLDKTPPLEDSEYVQSVRTKRARRNRVAYLTKKISGMTRRIADTPANTINYM
jgi:hypothetical protein